MINFELLSEQHVDQVAALEAVCFRMPWSKKSIAAELANPLSLWVVALDGETVAGYVGSQSVLGESDMMNLAVLPQYRRCGVGTELVRELISRLKDRQVHSLTLEVRQSNEEAIGLYKKMDFQQVGCRPNYYQNPREDALILRKEWNV